MRALQRYQTETATAAAAFVSLVAALVYHRAWLGNLRIPIDSTGDSLQKLMLAAAAGRHGWIFENPSVGLPGVGQHLDFPRYDTLSYFLIKLLYVIFGDPVVACNVFYLASFPLIAGSACFCMVRLGLSAAAALVGAVVYAWLPFHVVLGFPHFTNGFYVFVPFGVWLIFRVWHGNEDPLRRVRWYLPGATAVILLELQNSYYGFFFCVLLLSYAVLHAALRGVGAVKIRLAATGGLLLVAVCTFLLEQAPRLVFEAREAKNLQALVRPPAGSSEFALSLVDLVNPAVNHPIGAVGRFTQRAADALGHGTNERIFVSLPLLALVGFFVALWSLVWRAARVDAGNEATRLRQRAGVLIVIALVWAHEGGLCTLLGEIGFATIRGWNRIAVFIAFAALVAAGSFIDALSNKVRATRRALGFAALLAWSLFELASGSIRALFDLGRYRFDEARDFTARLTQDGKVHRAFVLPHIDYPEMGSILGVSEYDHFLLALTSERLRISYGSMKGRGSYYYGDAASKLSGQELVDFLIPGGFDTLVVDRSSPQGKAASGSLIGLLGEPPVKTARYLGFRLSGAAPGAGYRTYRLGEELDFGGDVTTRRFLEVNFSGFEVGGTWTLGKRASMRIATGTLPPSVVLDLGGQLFEGEPGRQSVEVRFDGAPLCTLTRANAEEGFPSAWRCSATLPDEVRGPGEHTVEFRIAAPTSPHSLEESRDQRPLGLRLASFRLSAP